MGFAYYLAGAGVELLGIRNPAGAPSAYLHDDRQKRDRLLRKAVDRFLFVGWVVGLGVHAVLDEPREAIPVRYLNGRDDQAPEHPDGI